MLVFAVAMVFVCRQAFADQAASCDLRACRLANLQYYLELGCKPETEPNTCCPQSFNCSAVRDEWARRELNKCYFRGRKYELGSRVSNQEVDSPCLRDCGCFYNSTRSHFRCSEKQCPESQQPALTDGCVRQYFSDGCCSTSVLCPSNSSAYSRHGEGFSCRYDNTTFLDGEMFTPSDFACKRCMCQKGFNGSVSGPWCVDVDCGLELHYPEQISRGCAPVYDSELHCCPEAWHCPNGSNDRLTDSKLDPGNTTAAKCLFGELKMDVGHKLLLPPALPFQCSCVVPPVLSCTRLQPQQSRHPPGARELTARPFDPCSDVRCQPGERCIALVPWRAKCVS